MIRQKRCNREKILSRRDEGICRFWSESRLQRAVVSERTVSLYHFYTTKRRFVLFGKRDEVLSRGESKSPGTRTLMGE